MLEIQFGHRCHADAAFFLSHDRMANVAILADHPSFRTHVLAVVATETSVEIEMAKRLMVQVRARFPPAFAMNKTLAMTITRRRRCHFIVRLLRSSFLIRRSRSSVAAKSAMVYFLTNIVRRIVRQALGNGGAPGSKAACEGYEQPAVILTVAPRENRNQNAHKQSLSNACSVRRMRRLSAHDFCSALHKPQRTETNDP